MTTFNWIDYSFMAFYATGLLALTLVLKRFASKGMNDYYLGGRTIPWWAMGISGMSSQFDMTGTMLLVSLLVLLGPQGMFVEVRGGLALIMAFAMVFQGKWNRRSGCMTVAEWMEYRFGTTGHGQLARMIQAAAMLVATIGMLAYFVKGAGLFLSTFLPFSPEVCALGMIAFATFYTAISGFYGVIFTDVFQSLFILAAVIIISFTAWSLFPTSASLEYAAASVSANTSWGSMALPWKAEMPSAYAGFELLGLSVFYYLIYTVLLGVSRSGGRPMYFGARNERECGTMSFLWIIMSTVRWPFVAGFAIIGIHLASTQLPEPAKLASISSSIHEYEPGAGENNWMQQLNRIIQNPDAFDPALIRFLESELGVNWKAKLPLVGYHGNLNFEQVLPSTIRDSIPPGLRGLLFIAMVAAGLTTFNSQLNMAAAYFVRDIYQRKIHPTATEKTLIYVSYATCVTIVLCSFILGYYAKSINELWGWIMIGLGGGLVVPAVLRWLWWRLNGVGYAAGTFAGIALAILQRLLFPGQPDWVIFPVILVGSVIFCIVGTFLSSQTDAATLLHFYKTTRPFGLWGPVKRQLPSEQITKINAENHNDILATVMALPWQFSLYWTAVMVMFKKWDGAIIGAAVILLTSICLYFLWYRKLPPAHGDREPTTTPQP
jgi:SSS family solute:Na+ symporter